MCYDNDDDGNIEDYTVDSVCVLFVYGGHFVQQH